MIYLELLTKEGDGRPMAPGRSWRKAIDAKVLPRPGDPIWIAGHDETEVRVVDVYFDSSLTAWAYLQTLVLDPTPEFDEYWPRAARSESRHLSAIWRSDPDEGETPETLYDQLVAYGWREE